MQSDDRKSCAQEEKHFDGKSCQNQVFSDVKFSSCCFSHVTLKETNCRKAHFSSCTFKGCQLDRVDMQGAVFHDVLFEECKIVAGAFFLCNTKLFSPQFKNCFLMGCNFSHLDMKRVDFSSSKIHDCYFNETVLVEANFQGVDLKGSAFHRADLSKADLRGAKNYGIDPTVNTLQGVRVSLPEALSFLEFFSVKIS